MWVKKKSKKNKMAIFISFYFGQWDRIDKQKKRESDDNKKECGANSSTGPL